MNEAPTIMTKDTYHKKIQCEHPQCRNRFTFGGRHHCRLCSSSICTQHSIENINIVYHNNMIRSCRYICVKCMERIVYQSNDQNEPLSPLRYYEMKGVKGFLYAKSHENLSALTTSSNVQSTPNGTVSSNPSHDGMITSMNEFTTPISKKSFSVLSPEKKYIRDLENESKILHETIGALNKQLERVPHAINGHSAHDELNRNDVNGVEEMKENGMNYRSTIDQLTHKLQHAESLNSTLTHQLEYEKSSKAKMMEEWNREKERNKTKLTSTEEKLTKKELSEHRLKAKLSAIVRELDESHREIDVMKQRLLSYDQRGERETEEDRFHGTALSGLDTVTILLTNDEILKEDEDLTDHAGLDTTIDSDPIVDSIVEPVDPVVNPVDPNTTNLESLQKKYNELYEDYDAAEKDIEYLQDLIREADEESKAQAKQLGSIIDHLLLERSHLEATVESLSEKIASDPILYGQRSDSSNRKEDDRGEYSYRYTNVERNSEFYFEASGSIHDHKNMSEVLNAMYTGGGSPIRESASERANQWAETRNRSKQQRREDNDRNDSSDSSCLKNQDLKVVTQPSEEILFVAEQIHHRAMGMKTDGDSLVMDQLLPRQREEELYHHAAEIIMNHNSAKIELIEAKKKNRDLEIEKESIETEVAKLQLECRELHKRLEQVPEGVVPQTTPENGGGSGSGLNSIQMRRRNSSNPTSKSSLPSVGSLDRDGKLLSLSMHNRMLIHASSPNPSSGEEDLMGSVDDISIHTIYRNDSFIQSPEVDGLINHMNPEVKSFSQSAMTTSAMTTTLHQSSRKLDFVNIYSSHDADLDDPSIQPLSTHHPSLRN